MSKYIYINGTKYEAVDNYNNGSNAVPIVEEIPADELLPPVTSIDNGKFLIVVEGKWQAAMLATWSGGNY